MSILWHAIYMLALCVQGRSDFVPVNFFEIEGYSKLMIFIQKSTCFSLTSANHSQSIADFIQKKIFFACKLCSNLQQIYYTFDEVTF